MIIQLYSLDAFFDAFKTSKFAYDSRDFVALNCRRDPAVRFFAGLDQDMRPSVGIILTLREQGWRCPFSAPFGNIYYAAEPSASLAYDFLSELKDTLGLAPVSITLPPLFHLDKSIQTSALVLGNLAAKQYYDYNYHYPLIQAAEYFSSLKGAGARNLRRALASDFRIETTDDIQRAYSIISRHHAAKGYPVRMSIDNVEATAKIIPTDFFLLTRQDKEVAAVMTQRVSADTQQLIYWGDLPGFSQFRPMNFLAHHLCMHYAQQPGIATLDFGPSSSDGIPSMGLCRFKESIGCVLSPKPTFTI